MVFVIKSVRGRYVVKGQPGIPHVDYQNPGASYASYAGSFALLTLSELGRTQQLLANSCKHTTWHRSTRSTKLPILRQRAV